MFPIVLFLYTNRTRKGVSHIVSVYEKAKGQETKKTPKYKNIYFPFRVTQRISEELCLHYSMQVYTKMAPTQEDLSLFSSL